MPKFIRLIPLLLLLAASASVRAQSIITLTPQQCIWHAGDNPAWAASNLDEAGWLPYSTWDPKSLEPRIWVRCHGNLAPSQSATRPALQISLYAAYEVYLDGRLIGSAGNLKTGAFTLNTIRDWPTAGDLPPSAVVALRVTRQIAFLIPVGKVPPLEIHAGAATLLHDRRSSVILAQVGPQLIPGVCFSIVGVLGVVLIPLWLSDRRRHELLLLSISCIVVPVIYWDRLAAAALVSYSMGAYAFAYAIAASIVNPTREIFFFALARRRVPLVFWILIIVGNGPYLPEAIEFLLPPSQALGLNTLVSHQLEAIGNIFRILENLAPFAAFLPWTRLTVRMKPLAVLSMAWGTVMMSLFAVRLTGQHIPGIPDLQARWSNVAADAEAITILVLVLALLVLLFREQQQTARERAILAGEMQAAQQVQCMLAPAVLGTLSGMRIDVAFHPIREVGGDFYSCRVLPGNRQRILIGDVSGKGAAAAMTAAVLLGATQQRDSDSAAALLHHLNRAMTDMRIGGFATCLCAEISIDGVLTIANAGHLAPYRRGEEIPLPPGLPLGLVPESEYAGTPVQLDPGDTLTFLSDGVLEARNAQGELFGFERTAAISTRSAEEIARAAQAHGQEDDITVLTLQFSPAEVAHA